MRHRYSLAAVLALVAICSATAVFAARPAPELTPIVTGTPLEHVQLGSPRVEAACQLGELGDPAWLIDYLLPPNDGYYTLIDPSSCACPGGAVQVNTINIALDFRTTCPVPVSISVVPATGAAGCYQPVPGSPICPPAQYVLTPAGPGQFVFSLPLPPGCCVQGPAFISVTFLSLPTSCSTAATRPRLITTGACNPCQSYNVYPGGFDDLCDVGFPGNPIMFADAECCGATPSQSSTWGRVKTMYR